MLTSIEPQDVAPLLPTDKSHESKNAGERVPPMVVTERTGFALAKKLSDCIYSRITYYWIAFIAQTCHLVLCAIGICVVAGTDQEAGSSAEIHSIGDFAMFSRTAIWSVGAYVVLGLLIIFHYRKDQKLCGRRMLAGLHVWYAWLCIILNATNCILIAVPYAVVSNLQEPTSKADTHPIIIPLMIGFLVVASITCFTASRITY